ncbi:gibberellin-regulated protein 10 [Dorcoceras hygrometricum]|uniref:Gibberellin-regulated protein 10 n=1 Tax=Dorcoceras hygrometricum TaxID=472368 RepID=A0A2Z7AEN4_9LAMI|nr:gibberellin-regulated protein 10 [Dorcoceras hygrometricum]
MNQWIATFLLLSLVFNSSSIGSFVEAEPSVCDDKCAVRCSKAGLRDRCLKYCGICCVACDECVPSGTYGNKDECPCYRDMKNSKGNPKCP